MIELRMPPGQIAAAAIDKLKLAAQRFPGDHELRLLLAVAGRDRPYTLSLGPMWRYDASPACLAALSEFGTAQVVAC